MNPSDERGLQPEAASGANSDSDVTKIQLATKDSERQPKVVQAFKWRSVEGMQVIGALANVVIAAAAVGTLAAALGTLLAVLRQLDNLDDSVRAVTSAAVYGHNGEITSTLVDHPQFFDYFEFKGKAKDLTKTADVAAIAARDDSLRKRYAAMEPLEQNRLNAVCIKYADLYDQIFVLRRNISDWDH